MPVLAYVFIAILVAAFAIAAASQVIGPSKLRQRFIEEMARRGWVAVSPGADEASPTAWVLVTMIEKSMPRLAELLDLAGEISQVLDTAASPARPA